MAVGHGGTVGPGHVADIVAARLEGGEGKQGGVGKALPDDLTVQFVAGNPNKHCFQPDDINLCFSLLDSGYE